MANVQAKIPDEQMEQIDTVVTRKAYPNRAEYVREAVRDKLEEDLETDDRISEEVIREATERLEKAMKGETELHDLKEVTKE